MQSTDYAGYFDINPGAMTLEQLDSFLNRTPLFKIELNVTHMTCGDRNCSITRVNVERDRSDPGTGNVPAFSRSRMDLTESMTYDSQGLKTLVTHEYY